MKLFIPIFLTALTTASSPSFDPASQSQTLTALTKMSSVLFSFYSANNAQGLIVENDSSKGVDGFQWYEGGIFCDLFMEYYRMTGDLDTATPIVNALSTASSATAGSFLGAVPALAALAGKWNDDLLWWAMGPTMGMQIFGMNKIMPGGINYDVLSATTFNQVIGSLDPTCGGGIFWSRNKAVNAGYKSTITQCQAMLIGAQLAISTGNQTYVQTSIKIYEWLKSSGVVTANYEVFDGVETSPTCSISKLQVSYEPGVLISALVWMYKATSNQMYLDNASDLLTTTLARYATGGIVADPCEPSCPLNQVSPKGSLVQGMGYLYEFSNDAITKNQIKAVLYKTVVAMVKVCDSDWMCGNNWETGQVAVSRSVHDQMNAFALMTAFYKTFGVQAKSNLVAPTNGNGVQGSNNGVQGSLPQGAGMSLSSSGFLLIACLIFAM